jgi:guanyl-specific ribonuclease Sa
VQFPELTPAGISTTQGVFLNAETAIIPQTSATTVANTAAATTANSSKELAKAGLKTITDGAKAFNCSNCGIQQLDEVVVNSAAKTSTRFVSTAEGVLHDLKPTLDRIASGGKFPHRNDGSIFKNMEGLLPKQNAGYYNEFVHPTLGVNGPGAMRVVTGQGGEMWFTPDHYKTFIPIR